MKTLLQVLALLCTLQFSAWAQTGQKWALLIGVDSYQNEAMQPLRFATRDTKAMREALLKQGYSDERVFAMTSDATGADYPSSLNVLKRLSALGERIKENDTFLFYFSGHGFQGEYGHFLATGDADPTDSETLERSTLPLKILQSKMQKISAKNAIFIIDACRDNPERGSKAGPNSLSGDFAKDLRLVAKSSGGGQSGAAILLSCSEGQRSWEWDEKDHSVFTYYIVEGLNGAARDANGQITMADLGEYVQNKVANWSLRTLKKQTPDMQQFGAAKIVIAQGKANPILDSLKPNIPFVPEVAPAATIPEPAYWPQQLLPLPVIKLQGILRENGAISFVRGEAHWGMMRVQSFDAQKQVLTVEVRQRFAKSMELLPTRPIEVWTHRLHLPSLDPNSVQLDAPIVPGLYQVTVSTRSKAPLVLHVYDAQASSQLNGGSTPLSGATNFAQVEWPIGFNSQDLARRFADELKALIQNAARDTTRPTPDSAPNLAVTAPKSERSKEAVAGEIGRVLDGKKEFMGEVVEANGRKTPTKFSLSASGRVAGGAIQITSTRQIGDDPLPRRIIFHVMPARMNDTTDIISNQSGTFVRLHAKEGTVRVQYIGFPPSHKKEDAFAEILLPMANRSEAEQVANLFSELFAWY